MPTELGYKVFTWHLLPSLIFKSKLVGPLYVAMLSQLNCKTCLESLWYAEKVFPRQDTLAYLVSSFIRLTLELIVEDL